MLLRKDKRIKPAARKLWEKQASLIINKLAARFPKQFTFTVNFSQLAGVALADLEKAIVALYYSQLEKAGWRVGHIGFCMGLVRIESKPVQRISSRNCNYALEA